MSRLRPDKTIEFYTFGNNLTREYLTQLAEEINFQYTVYPTPHLVQFCYDYPMAGPSIVPRPETLNSHENVMAINGEVILYYYGMIEGNSIVYGDKVIYDPQSPVHSILFSVTGSKAKIKTHVH